MSILIKKIVVITINIAIFLGANNKIKVISYYYQHYSNNYKNINLNYNFFYYVIIIGPFF